MTAPLVVSSYPLSSGYRASIERIVGPDAIYCTIAAIRRDGISTSLRRAWFGKRRPIFLAVEAESSRCLEPALCALAAMLRGSPINVISPDASVRGVSVPQVASSCMHLAMASVDGRVARAQSRIRPARYSPQDSTALERIGRGWSGSRVLYIKNTLSTGVRAGGSVGHVAGVVNALVSAGADVKMITTEPSPMIDAGVHEVHPRGMDVLGLPSQINMFRMQRQTVRRALELTASWRPDVIYQRLTLGDASGAILSEATGIPLITEYNGSEVWCNQNWGAGVRYATEFLAAEEAMLRASSMTFTISRVLADQLRSRGLPDQRIGWYPNCIDPAVYSPERFSAEEIRTARGKIGFDDRHFVVTFVGTFGDWHGADVFAKAIAIGSEPGGVFGQLPLRFLFVGDGNNRQKAQSIIRASAAEDRCRFVGLVPQADTPLLLAGSSCFVSPHVPNPDGTSFFGSPTKLFEYMAMRRPIIASRLEQLAEVLEDGKSALLVEPGNPHELARAIQSLASDAQLGAALATGARQVALDRYTWNAHVAHMSDGIRRLTSAESTTFNRQ